MGTEQQLSHEETLRILHNWYAVGDRIERHFIAVRPGTIVGFGKKYIPRGGFDHKRAGVYMDLFSLRIQGADGSEWTQVFGKSLYRRELQRAYGEIALLDIRLGNLPDTPFWVGDYVQTVGRLSDPAHVVTNICYNYGDSGEIRYSTTATPESDLIFDEREKSLVLIERGNIWKLEHGEPLSFPGDTPEKRLLEEAAFYKSLGMSQKLVNTKEKDGLWSMKEAFDLLALGEVHKIIIKGAYGNTPQGPRVVLIKYDNEDLGRRIRNETLRGFGITPSPENVEDCDVNFGYIPGENARSEPDTDEK